VIEGASRLLERLTRLRKGGFGGIGRIEADVELGRQAFELQDRRWTVYVSAGQQHFLALVLLEPFGQLGRGGGFAGALQTGEQHHHRRLRPQIERAYALAHQRDQLVVDDPDERLPRGETLVDLAA